MHYLIDRHDKRYGFKGSPDSAILSHKRDMFCTEHDFLLWTFSSARKRNSVILWCDYRGFGSYFWNWKHFLCSFGWLENCKKSRASYILCPLLFLWTTFSIIWAMFLDLSTKYKEQPKEARGERWNLFSLQAINSSVQWKSEWRFLHFQLNFFWPSSTDIVEVHNENV